MMDVLPGDHLKLNLRSLIESLPMIAPNLGLYKACFDFYFEPWTNLYGWMDNNTRVSTEDTFYMARHNWVYSTTYQESPSTPINYMFDRRVRPGSFANMFGLPVGFTHFRSEDTQPLNGRFPAEKALAYLDIIRNYYVNNQEDVAYYVRPSTIGDSLDPASANLRSISLKTLDNVFKYIRMQNDGIDISDPSSWTGDFDQYNNHRTALRDWFSDMITTNGGLFLKTYQMDLNRGMLNARVGDFKSLVTVSDNQFSIDTLRFANKFQKWIDRVDLSGGRFSDIMRSRWAVTPRGDLDIPDYLGSITEFFGITDVIATSSGDSNEEGNGKRNVLGQQAGFAVAGINRNNKPISFRSDQYGTFVCIFSLIPVVTYSQGIERENLKLNFSDIYDPAFKQLGYEDVPLKELTSFDVFRSGDRLLSNELQRGEIYYEDVVETNSPAFADLKVGKRIAWAEYMSALPRSYGLFAYGQEFDYWVNNRMYQWPDSAVEVVENGSSSTPYDKDYCDSFAQWYKLHGTQTLSTYINPAVQNHLFTDTRFDAHNFRLRAKFDIELRRPIGSRIMPHM